MCSKKLCTSELNKKQCTISTVQTLDMVSLAKFNPFNPHIQVYPGQLDDRIYISCNERVKT
jgi:hypothetical protein